LWWYVDCSKPYEGWCDQMKTISGLILAGAFCAGAVYAQVPNPTQNVPQSETSPQMQGSQSMPIYRVTVVRRTASAINYRHRSGATKVDFRGTELLPRARGEAKVESKQGYIEIEVEFDNLEAASRFGPEYLTYVMWAITPEGRASNLGEVILNGSKSKLNVTTEMQSFGLIVTAEPYFAVTQPSDVVVMENIVRADTRGKIDTIEANYELLRRGVYTLAANPGSLKPVVFDRKTPLELYQARNALQIARWAGADKYATEAFLRAESSLNQAEVYQRQRPGQKPVSMTAREAVQRAEDARLITVRRQDEERLAQERQAAAEREARAKAEAEASAEQQRLEAERRARAEQEKAIADAQRRQAEAERAAADATRALAEKARAEADLSAQRAREEAAESARQMQEQRAAAARELEEQRAAAERIKAEAEAARQAALAEQQRAQADAERARQQAEEANRLRQRAEQDRENVRNQLMQQLNMVLETRESARGLIVNMSDVLFDTGRSTLKPGAREKLARVSGILLAHPGLNIEVEGHTDSVGGEAYNQRLSEQRAEAVRLFLVQNGVPQQSISSRGFGKMNPVASNDNAAGRQRNRRVELVVSGDIIGRQLRGTVYTTQPVEPPRQ
jgi:outer membrane protein OmpA-like peptidoglycan-associated protein